MKGRESQSDGVTESGTQKEVSSKRVDTSKFETLAKT